MKTFRLSLLSLLASALFIVSLFSCKKDLSDPTLTSNAGKVATITTPVLSATDVTQTSIDLIVTAPLGGSGLPAGFSVQWMTVADYVANNNQWYLSEDTRLCKASFSGNASASRYNLLAGESVTVRIGDFLVDNGASVFNCVDGLTCGTAYMFRVFGHATSKLVKSDLAFLRQATADCEASCTHKHYGYWKNHCELIPATLDLGTVTYTHDQICTFLNTGGSGDGLLILAHQLIAAKLNGENNDAASVDYNANVAAAEAAIAYGANGTGSYIVGVNKPGASWQRTLSGVLNKYNSCP